MANFSWHCAKMRTLSQCVYINFKLKMHIADNHWTYIDTILKMLLLCCFIELENDAVPRIRNVHFFIDNAWDTDTVRLHVLFSAAKSTLCLTKHIVEWANSWNTRRWSHHQYFDKVEVLFRWGNLIDFTVGICPFADVFSFLRHNVFLAIAPHVPVHHTRQR